MVSGVKTQHIIFYSPISISSARRSLGFVSEAFTDVGQFRETEAKNRVKFGVYPTLKKGSLRVRF